MTTAQRVDEALAEMRRVMRAIMLAEHIAGAESERAAHNQATEGKQ